MSKVLVIKDNLELWKFVSENGQFIYSDVDNSSTKMFSYTFSPN